MTMYEIEQSFENALKRKDEVYKSHNERMNQIFNKSSSDNSEDYLAEWERANNGEEDMRMRVESQRKRQPRDSEEQEGTAGL